MKRREKVLSTALRNQTSWLHQWIGGLVNEASQAFIRDESFHGLSVEATQPIINVVIVN